MRKCSVEDCDNKHRIRGYCPTHYYRWRENGSPYLIKIKTSDGYILETRPVRKIDGRTKKQYYCKRCNRKIAFETGLYRSGLCSSCGFFESPDVYHFPIMKGYCHPNWKGGISSLRERIYCSDKHEQWRLAVFERDNFTCQNCGDKTGNNLNAHHNIKSFHKIIEEFLKEYDQFSPIEDKETLVRLATKYQPFWDVDNGLTYCKRCHRHNKYSIPNQRKGGNMPK